MNYLGLDYGKKHIGVAFSSGSIACPLETLPLETTLSVLPQLLKAYQAKAIIVGLPDGPVRADVEQFVQNLRILNLPVEIADETLSSQDAVSSLLHTSKSRRHSKHHAAAAAIILQNWLDSHTINS